MDNYYLHRQQELLQQQQESLHSHCNEEINHLKEELEDVKRSTKSDIDYVIELLTEYDIENNAGMANQIEQAREMLVKIYDKLEE